MHSSINRATVTLAKTTPIRSFSIMAVGNFYEDAVDQLSANGLTDVGVHLSLTSEYPKLPTRPLGDLSSTPSLIDKDGYFHRSIEELKQALELVDVKDELNRQIDRVIQSGLTITHLDTHMFFFESLHDVPGLQDCVRSLARQLKVPLRDRHADKVHFIWDECPEAASRESFYRDLIVNYSDAFSELIIHPADDLEAISKFSKSAERRVADFNFFKNHGAECLNANSRLQLVSWLECANKSKR